MAAPSRLKGICALLFNLSLGAYKLYLLMYQPPGITQIHHPLKCMSIIHRSLRGIPTMFSFLSPLKKKKQQSLTCWVAQTKGCSLPPLAAVTWEVGVVLSARAFRESFKWAPGSWIGSRGETLGGGRIWKPCSVKHEWKKTED